MSVDSRSAALSHHDVIAMAEPFARGGWRLDLQASRREEGHLVFAPAPPSGNLGDAPAGAELRVRLDLQLSPGRRPRLERTLFDEQGHSARLVVRGNSVAALLEASASVDPGRQWRIGPGFTLMRDYELDLARDADRPVLTAGRVHLAGARLTLTVADAKGVSGEWQLKAAEGRAPAWPEDLLAVLGWDWSRLVRDARGASGRLRLRGGLEQRTRRAEAALEAAASHLASTLSQSPTMYHARWAAARRGVFFRRAIPTLTAIALVASVLLLMQLEVKLSMAQWIALYHVPTLIVALSFALQELPRFELPPWPRTLAASSWTEAG